MRFLARLALEFRSVLNLPKLLDDVTRALREEIGFDSCAISLLAHERGEDVLVVRTASGLRDTTTGTRIPRGQGLSWVVMESATPLLVGDLSSEPRWFLKDKRSRSAIYTPLMGQHGSIGVLSAYIEALDGFTDADLHLLTVVARYMASAVEVGHLYEQLTHLAATDPLTGVANRRALLERIESEIARSRRKGLELSVVLLDLNHFKQVNDLYGHATGDEVLRRMAGRLAETIRQSDVVGRLGGDEFAVLLPESTSEEADNVVNRLSHLVTAIPTKKGGTVEVSCAWGVASWPRDGSDVAQLLQAADDRLYAMKWSSR